MPRLAFITAAAMIAFAANSILARLALAAGDIDALGYTGVRLLSGAVVLAGLIVWTQRKDPAAPRGLSGSWAGAGALGAYALFFSLAYLMIGAGAGALVLFASVQIGMLGWAIIKGDRPGLLEWAGMAVAFGGLAYLVSPGLAAPDPVGTGMMVVSGLAWASYSLLGRGSKSPLADTAGNFIRCAPSALVLVVVGLASQTPSASGLAYAVASGALASGLGYVIWYAALPGLSRTRAAIVQLTVPAIAAAGGVMLLSEPVTVRLLVALTAILGGVALALLAAEKRRTKAV